MWRRKLYQGFEGGGDGVGVLGKGGERKGMDKVERRREDLFDKISKGWICFFK